MEKMLDNYKCAKKLRDYQSCLEKNKWIIFKWLIIVEILFTVITQNFFKSSMSSRRLNLE
jgi:hypothetical protein